MWRVMLERLIFESYVVLLNERLYRPLELVNFRISLVMKSWQFHV